RVDVSTDFGRTWTAAALDSDRAKYTWRRFRYSWKPPRRGSFVAVSRATDSQGRTQPVVASWTPAGYMYNVVDKVRINVQDQCRRSCPVDSAAPSRGCADAGCIIGSGLHSILSWSQFD